MKSHVQIIAGCFDMMTEYMFVFTATNHHTWPRTFGAQSDQPSFCVRRREQPVRIIHPSSFVNVKSLVSACSISALCIIADIYRKKTVYICMSISQSWLHWLLNELICLLFWSTLDFSKWSFVHWLPAGCHRWRCHTYAKAVLLQKQQFLRKPMPFPAYEK